MKANKSEQFLKSVYGKDLYEKIKKGGIKKFDWSQEIDQSKLSTFDNRMLLNQNVFIIEMILY